MNEKPNRFLPEILVAGLIILIVGFMIARTYTGSMARAHRTACINNINQLSMAMRMYADDHDQGLPRSGWQDAVMPWVSEEPDWNVYYCPARDDEKGWSYGMNWAVAGADDSSMPDPSVLILLVDVRNDTREFWWANDIRFHRFHRNRVPRPVHQGRANIAFCDGHVVCADPFRMTVDNWIPRRDGP